MSGLRRLASVVVLGTLSAGCGGAGEGGDTGGAIAFEREPAR